MTFKDFKLNKYLLNALADLGYTIPTSIQQKVFSVVMSGADVCGIAQTGTGKTLGYLLPLLNMWKYTKEKHPQILILVPTRELVAQVVETVSKLSVYQSVDVSGVYGGTNINTQKLQLEQGADVLVGTPGRLYDLAMTGAFKLKSVKKLVIDEMDEMLNLGFRKQLTDILDLLPSSRQNLLFSATLIPEVEIFIDEYFNFPVRIEAAPPGTPLGNISQIAYEVPNFHTKVNLLKLLFTRNEDFVKVLVFTASKQIADDVFTLLEPVFPDKLGVIHSNKEQNHRFNTVNRFKDASLRFVIATDVVARGIDVAGVSHVINFDLPSLPENYIHRIGRTGRADQQGEAISFVTPAEQGRRTAIEELMSIPIPVADLPEGLEISAVLTADEEPKVYMKEPALKLPAREERGAAFHPRSAKNSKTNSKESRREQMKKKYGKPITRRGKR